MPTVNSDEFNSFDSKVEEIEHDNRHAFGGLHAIRSGTKINYEIVVNMLESALKREKILLEILNEQDDLK